MERNIIYLNFIVYRSYNAHHIRIITKLESFEVKGFWEKRNFNLICKFFYKQGYAIVL